ncbi:MAG: hypothetical protein ABI683_02185 [Ginsengibacter sp.]
MLKAILISNNIEGLENYFQSNEKVSYEISHVTKHFYPDLSSYDLLIVPNGSDQVAMGKIKDKVKDFLDEGKALICCDGWFTNWVPGNQWRMDNDKKTIDIRYFVKDDPHGFFKGLDVNEFIFSHGISGYWACGYIVAAENATVILEDTWQRPIIVLDEKTTNGLMFLTASGPLGDMTFDGKESKKQSSLVKLYQHVIDYLITVKKQAYA